MQKRSRRPHGIRAIKISISVSADDLEVLSARAKRKHGGNLSAVVHEMVATVRRLEAADRVLERLDGNRITEKDMQQIRDEIADSRRRRPHGRAA